MSHSARSASLTGLPNPGVSARAAVAQNPSETAAASRALRVDMLRLPVAVDGPGRNVIHVALGEGGYRKVDRRCAALGEHFRLRRLDVSGLVPGAALQHDRLAVPAPGH